MKYLVAFALLAVAAALPQPLRLLDPSPIDIAPLVVPQQVMDEIALTVKVVDAPEPQAAEDSSAYAVKIVEEASNVEAAPVSEDAFAVNFVEEAVNVEPSPVEAEDNSAFAVNFVDAVPEAPDVKASEDVSAYAVNFVDGTVNPDIPATINIQVPLPNSVVLPLKPIVLPSVGSVMIADSPVESRVAQAVSPVKIVYVANVDEETPSYMPIKLYPDPMWR